MRSSAARQEHRALSRATIPGACRGLGEAWLWHRGAKELGREANTPVGKTLGVPEQGAQAQSQLAGALEAGVSYPFRGRQSLSQAGRKIGLLASTLIRAQMKIKRLEIQCTVWNGVFLGKI